MADLGSSSSEASGDHETPPLSQGSKKGVTVKQELLNDGYKGRGDREFEHLPIVYAPHSSQPPGQSQHQYKCKYPGCNQVGHTH